MGFVETSNSELNNEIVLPDKFDENNCLLIPVQPALINSESVSIFAVNQDFNPKEEFHITIIGNKNIVSELTDKIEEFNPDQQIEFKNKLSGLTQLLGNITFIDEYYLVKKNYETEEGNEERQSIIQKVNVEGIDDFYKEFSSLTGIDLGTPFPHVTLFTKGNKPTSSKGIGIASLESFNILEHHAINL